MRTRNRSRRSSPNSPGATSVSTASASRALRSAWSRRPIEVTGGRVPASVIGTIIAAGREMVEHPVETLPHVRETLEELAGDYRLILITKGDLFDQERKLAASGLGELFHAVEIVGDKTAATYERAFKRHGDGPQRGMMVGNSLKSDVLPAIAAGSWGVYVPHELTNALEHAEEPIGDPRFRRLAHLGELADLSPGSAERGVALRDRRSDPVPMEERRRIALNRSGCSRLGRCAVPSISANSTCGMAVRRCAHRSRRCGKSRSPQTSRTASRARRDANRRRSCRSPRRWAAHAAPCRSCRGKARATSPPTRPSRLSRPVEPQMRFEQVHPVEVAGAFRLARAPPSAHRSSRRDTRRPALRRRRGATSTSAARSASATIARTR